MSNTRQIKRQIRTEYNIKLKQQIHKPTGNR